MNERIQELWDKAAKSTAAYPSGQNNSWETQVNFMEKFAQLIVRECAEAVKNSIWHLPRGYKAEDQAEFVKKHFGVE